MQNYRDILVRLIDKITKKLKELEKDTDPAHAEFNYGQRTAYVETLEIIQVYGDTYDLDLYYVIEQVFPL